MKRLPGLVYGLVGLDLQFKLGITLGNIPLGIVASVVETDEVTDLIDLKLNLAEAVSKLKLTNKNDLNYVNLLHTYRLRVKDNLKDLMDFNSGLKGFCSHPDATIKFRTSDEDPVNVRQYDLPFVHREIVDAQIKQWFDTGIIEKSTELDHSNNPVMVVPKRDLQGKVKGWRVCIDPRRINAKIKSSTFPLPLAKDIFDSLEGNQIYSIIDLQSGFNQMNVLLADRKKTAFTWKGVTYQFRGAPFGFKNIPQDFQRIMSKVLEILPAVLVYIDDIIISSATYEEHVKHLREVLERLNKNNLKINVQKCHFAYNEIIILGHRISKLGHTLAKEKLSKMNSSSIRTPTVKGLKKRIL